jgi:hypothetical protein
MVEKRVYTPNSFSNIPTSNFIKEFPVPLNGFLSVAYQSFVPTVTINVPTVTVNDKGFNSYSRVIYFR